MSTNKTSTLVIFGNSLDLIQKFSDAVQANLSSAQHKKSSNEYSILHQDFAAAPSAQAIAFIFDMMSQDSLELVLKDYQKLKGKINRHNLILVGERNTQLDKKDMIKAANEFALQYGMTFLETWIKEKKGIDQFINILNKLNSNINQKSNSSKSPSKLSPQQTINASKFDLNFMVPPSPSSKSKSKQSPSSFQQSPYSNKQSHKSSLGTTQQQKQQSQEKTSSLDQQKKKSISPQLNISQSKISSTKSYRGNVFTIIESIPQISLQDSTRKGINEEKSNKQNESNNENINQAEITEMEILYNKIEEIQVKEREYYLKFQSSYKEINSLKQQNSSLDNQKHGNKELKDLFESISNKFNQMKDDIKIFDLNHNSAKNALDTILQVKEWKKTIFSYISDEKKKSDLLQMCEQILYENNAILLELIIMNDVMPYEILTLDDGIINSLIYKLILNKQILDNKLTKDGFLKYQLFQILLQNKFPSLNEEQIIQVLEQSLTPQSESNNIQINVKQNLMHLTPSQLMKLHLQEPQKDVLPKQQSYHKNNIKLPQQQNDSLSNQNFRPLISLKSLDSKQIDKQQLKFIFPSSKTEEKMNISLFFPHSKSQKNGSNEVRIKNQTIIPILNSNKRNFLSYFIGGKIQHNITQTSTSHSPIKQQNQSNSNKQSSSQNPLENSFMDNNSNKLLKRNN